MGSLTPTLLLLFLAGLLELGQARGVLAHGNTRHYLARHEATVREIPFGAKKARIWLVVPRDDPAQILGQIKLSGPGRSRVHRGGTYNNRYAYFEVENPPATLTVAAEFTLDRSEVRVRVDPQAVVPASKPGRTRFFAELQANRFVPVNDKYRKLAREVVGDEQNPLRQARKLYDWVLEYVECWEKDPERLKASPNGESDYCLATRTGNCTDFHSLYTSLARSLGIPTRMVFGSFLQGENTPVPNKASLDGKEADASYHCWAEVYAEGVGWVPLDVALADLLPTRKQQEWYFGNLDARRVTWSYGRDLILAPRQDAGPVNAMHKVYVEIDGKPHTAWERRFIYKSRPH